LPSATMAISGGFTKGVAYVPPMVPATDCIVRHANADGNAALLTYAVSLQPL